MQHLVDYHASNAPKPLSSAILPKLTVAVFDREDCPEWATGAMVGKSGAGFWCAGFLSVLGDSWNITDASVEAIPNGHFDASDWQNSLIKRPEKKKLPDWCKVGAWVFDETLRQYEQVTEVNKTSFVTTHCTRYSATGLKPARLRPWTFEEAPLEFKTKDDVFILLYIQDKQEWGYWAKKECEEYTLSEVAELIQADGSPCGVTEVGE